MVPRVVDQTVAPGAPVPGAQTLIAIGLLMAVSIHFVPAFFGLPFLVQFLNALRIGKAPPLNGADDVNDGDAREGSRP